MKSKRRVVNTTKHLDIPQLYDDVEAVPEKLSNGRVPAKSKKRSVLVPAAVSNRKTGKRWVLAQDVPTAPQRSPKKKSSRKKKSIFSHKKNRTKSSFFSKRTERKQNDLVSRVKKTKQKQSKLVSSPNLRASDYPDRLWFFSVNGKRMAPMVLAAQPSQALRLLDGVLDGLERGDVEFCSIPVLAC